MKVSYYTIDDLRLGHDPRETDGWRLCRFLSLDRALEHYRAMPASGVKALGVTNGVHVLELVRCHPLFPGDKEGEDVLASDYQAFPLWRDVPEAAEGAETVTAALHLRYRLDGDRLIPIPTKKKLPKRLHGLCLRADSGEASVRWAYVVGEGLIPPSALKRPRAALPLVLYYMAECVAEDGTIVTLEVTPWEYEQLARRAKERCA